MQTRTVPLLEVIPETVENKHFYTNGLSKIIPRLNLKVHTDHEQCYRLWDKFSPKKTLFDLWDYRYSWQKAYDYKMYFYTLYEGRRVLGTLPLWYNEKEQKYEWWGGYWMEQNSFFVEDEKLIDLLLASVTGPVSLLSINHFDKKDQLHASEGFQVEKDLKYTKKVDGYSDMSGLLKSFTKKHRYNLKSDYQRIMKQNPQVKIVESNDEFHVEEFTSLNKLRFDGAQKDTSIYMDERELQAFKNIVSNAELYKSKFIKTFINGKLAASDLILDFNQTYYQFAGANDVFTFSGIGIFMVYVELEDAIRNGFKTVDCLQEDHSWKHRYFNGHEMYYFEK